MSERISDEELGQWAEKRADDAGRLARELVPLRARVAKLEAALQQLYDEDEYASIEFLQSVVALLSQTPDAEKLVAQRHISEMDLDG